MYSPIRQVKGYIGLFLASIFALFLFSYINPAQAQNYQTQKGPLTSNAICGAADIMTGKLLPACGYEKATKVGKARGECPPGTIFDIGLWACYSCPPGYNRTGFAVDTEKACSRQIPAHYTAGTRVGPHMACPPGSVWDPRNQGECWKCPSGYGRNMFAAVNAWDACGAFGKTARSAEFLGSVCPEGSFPDLNGSCYTCPEDAVRTGEAITHHRACMRNEDQVPAKKEAALTCKPGEHFDFIDGGTCWTCPEGSTRSWSSVTSNEACEFVTMRWKSTVRTSNGLFAIPGGFEIAADVINSPGVLEDVMQRYMKKHNLTDDSSVEKAVAFAKEAPEQSPVLLAAVYERMLAIIKNGAKTDYERKFVKYFAIYIQQTRQLTAHEMDRAWKSWQRGIELRKVERITPQTNMADIYDVGYAPPDIDTLVGESLHLAPAGILGLTFASGLLLEKASTGFTNAGTALAKYVFPHAYRKAAQVVGFASRATMFPFLVTAAASVIFSFAQENAEAQIKQRSLVADAMEVAKRPVNLALLLQQEKGRDEALTNWTLMTQEQIKPNAKAWADVVNASGSVDDGTQWSDLPQIARDIAIGSDGNIYIVSDKLLQRRQVTEKNGNSASISFVDTAEEGEASRIMKFNPRTKKFEDIPGLAATSIAVSGDVLWGINDKGETFYAYGNGARLTTKVVPGPKAVEIGGAEGSVFMLDTAGTPYRFMDGRWVKESGQATSLDVDSMGQAWAVNAKHEIWAQSGAKWNKLSGEGSDVAVARSGKGFVVGLDGMIYAYQKDSKSWKSLGWQKNAVRVATGGSQLWRITNEGKVSQWR